LQGNVTTHGERLWDAANDGDVEHVKSLLTIATLEDVNWKNMNHVRTSLLNRIYSISIISVYLCVLAGW